MRISNETRLSTGLIAVWTIILACAIPAVRNAVGNTVPASSHAAARSALEITGLQYTEYDASGLSTSIRADRLTILPHRFLFFNLKSFNEAHLENADIEIHLHDKAPPNGDMVPLVTDMFIQEKRTSAKRRPGSEFGLIARSIVEGVSVKIFNAELPSIILRAKRATVDRRKHRTRFQYATLEDARSDRRITGKEIIWDDRDKAFLIPGDYIAETAAGNARAKGARVSLDYVVTPLLN
jgi:hypothetical protein